MNLLLFSWNDFWGKTVEILKIAGINIGKLILAFIIGFIAIKIVIRILKQIFLKTKLDPAAQKFILATVKFGLYLLLLILMAQLISIPTTGFIAVLSAAGLALSLALQGSLSNLANGVVIISTKPFKEGDFVKIDETEGSVIAIKMLHTILKTSDNKMVSIPNKTVVESNIVNYNKLGKRSVRIDFEIAYSSDVDKAKRIILKVLKSFDKIDLTPEPFCALDRLTASSLVLFSSCTCDADAYWDVYYYIMDNVFNEFKRGDISIPFNQLEVRVLSNNEKKHVRESSLNERKTKEAAVVGKNEEDEDSFEGIFNVLTGKKLRKSIKEKAKKSVAEKELKKQKKDNAKKGKDEISEVIKEKK